LSPPFRFMAILGQHYPTWREARAELNELPLTAEWRLAKPRIMRIGLGREAKGKVPSTGDPRIWQTPSRKHCADRRIKKRLTKCLNKRGKFS